MSFSHDALRQRAARARHVSKENGHIDGWVLLKQMTSFGPEGTWTNIDLDVTPPERRVWTAPSILEYWVSDILPAHISDFTRYSKKPRTIYTQTPFFPLICFIIALLGIISASASKTLYGEYVWDPLTLATYWKSAAGRLGVCANVISVSDDMASLSRKYIILRHGAVIATVIGGWVMVPWKIVTSAEGLIDFMGSLGISLAPIIAISIADYWIVKRQRVDVAALYRPHAKYHCLGGVNWRALLAMACSIGPTLPSLAKNISPSLNIGGAEYIADLVWYYSFFSSFLVYIAVSKIWPAEETVVYKDELVEDTELDVQVVSELPLKMDS
ncbi:hypothetical protein LTR85_002049 [Meristemomyces frigidus]|nr:hypothetical protein LTR85_002049 [Meristemomyces frigidus]